MSGPSLEIAQDNPNITIDAKFSFEQNNTFSLTYNLLTKTELAPEGGLAPFFSTIVWPQCNNDKQFNDLTRRIVTAIVYAKSYLIIGASNKGASFDVSGSGTGMFEFFTGTAGASLSVANNSGGEVSMQYDDPDSAPYDIVKKTGSQGQPVGCVLMAFSNKHKGTPYLNMKADGKTFTA